MAASAVVYDVSPCHSVSSMAIDSAFGALSMVMGADLPEAGSGGFLTCFFGIDFGFAPNLIEVVIIIATIIMLMALGYLARS